jgi:hypothetical protein
MASSSCKLGLVLPESFHIAMIALAARGPSGRGALQAAYAAALQALLADLDEGRPVTFPAVRGPKIRVTLRLPRGLCETIRARLAALTLKLTDFACAAVSRFLAQAEGA